MIELVRRELSALEPHRPLSVVSQVNGGRDQDREEYPAAATNNQWKKDGQHSSARIGFVGARQADAIQDQRPNARDDSAANWNHLEWAGRALRESQNAQCGFKCLVRAANDHQTQMDNRAANKQSQHDENRKKNDKRDRANTHSGQDSKSVSMSHGKTDRLKTERKKKRDDAPGASADQSVDDWPSQAALHFH